MRDPELEALDGKRVVVDGDVHGPLIIARTIAPA